MYGKALPFSVNFGQCGKVFPCVIQKYFTTFHNEIWQFYSFSDVLSSWGQIFRCIFQEFSLKGEWSAGYLIFQLFI